MIKISDSPNHTGIIVRGAAEDFDELYDALHDLLHNLDGLDGGETRESSTSLRMLALCYDVRHNHPVVSAASVRREPERDFSSVISFSTGKPLEPEPPFEDDDDPEGEDELAAKREHECRMYWPETIFYCFVLNIYLGNQYSLRSLKPFKDLDWTSQWLTVRKFQALILECLCSLMAPAKVKEILKLYRDPFLSVSGFCTQYVDILMRDYLATPPEKRIRLLGLIPGKIMRRGMEYNTLEDDVRKVAERHGIPAWEPDVGFNYPDKVEW